MGMFWPRNITVFPALRVLARSFSLPTGKFRSSRRFLISCPTAPVAPKMATVYSFIAIHILSLPKAKSF
jgi:hypothetical protein